jgi:hypothetical protein
MKEINFRIIELPTHQILLSKDFDDEEDEGKELLVITLFIEGVKVAQKFGYNEEKTRNKVFNELTDEQAQQALNNALQLFNQ